MPVDIASPEDIRAAIQLLPENQRPYGADCPWSLTIQSIFYHYDVDAEAVSYIVGEKLLRLKHFKMADPEGDENQRSLFDAIICRIESPLSRHCVRSAFFRLLSANPMAALPPIGAAGGKRAASNDENAVASDGGQSNKKAKVGAWQSGRSVGAWHSGRSVGAWQSGPFPRPSSSTENNPSPPNEEPLHFPTQEVGDGGIVNTRSLDGSRNLYRQKRPNCRNASGPKYIHVYACP